MSELVEQLRGTSGDAHNKHWELHLKAAERIEQLESDAETYGKKDQANYDLQRQLAQAQEIIKEQKVTIENVQHVSQLPYDQNLSLRQQVTEQSELIEKLAQRIYDLYGPFNKIDAGYDQELIAYNNWKENK